MATIKTNGSDEHIAVSRFREFLRIKTVQPKPDYEGCTAFLSSMAKELGLDFHTVECVKGKPTCIFTWVGTDPSLPSLMLNCHSDVVPVSEDKWTHDPFAADKLENGDIIARGAQDMKCVGIQYLEAIRILKHQNKRPLRTVHVTFVPDEEIGGIEGMKLFVKTDEFKKLNVGFALDEGLANPGNAYKLFYGERAPWWLTLKAKGGAGHGSQFIEPSATLRLLKVLNKFIAFREAENIRLRYGRKENGEGYKLGDVTTTNITILKAGVQHNVVPEAAQAGIDIRIATTVDLHAFKRQIEEWCSEDGIEIEWVNTFWSNACTLTDDTNVWWRIVKGVADKRNIKLEPEIFPAATDSRYIREVGIPAFGISPMRNTPVLLHDHDEYLNEKVFLEGVEFYVDLIEAYWNVRG
ncbi:N-acyl-L-amino-acid amidohydrolase [Spizellomyces punctatus DAOM BR117]|uniref:N-acyl-aliphatic-L-amino acid amidohydrolase n=1 Tax=Spizellomyces punctatus (strain DAOM BR117) TaxID=645134 RepID=A0A0L0H3K6_SPIPD|nr:N-acyl-L-amino-acid amidohydrolase, variant [Spizellomyces punctatus DAOM BR117]XP_016604096.1 N-acyl-L-amino-acid amidohydrolase [Spizellomyces punctatus DAOM BR117]KNC96055.1 N-acyl-L-amino-acid amidohydrolase, variant [Spizellomyces punctatus DAOM BR117]KNC96056.1 N-acyl-L-amino-acid amidohydrolase [Spizellomyces punctatus DAOM BR117]|eukprot:XP_016604095.1 N-acyl-L-amino-acid amidohydrolase, variant [Spizellomyces punctatus DAOM BR117]